MATMERSMNSRMAIRIAIALLVGLLSCTTGMARQKNAPAIVDGMHLVPDTRLGLVYMDPEAGLAVYKKLLLMGAQVAFRKNWQRDTNQSKPFHVTAADMRRIKPEVAALFREIFARELAFAGDMTLYLELRDPITGDLLAKALDFQFYRSNGTTFMMDRTRNANAENRILTNWAHVLVKGLLKTRVKTSSQ
jgi:hypothetical protein